MFTCCVLDILRWAALFRRLITHIPIRTIRTCPGRLTTTSQQYLSSSIPTSIPKFQSMSSPARTTAPNRWRRRRIRRATRPKSRLERAESRPKFITKSTHQSNTRAQCNLLRLKRWLNRPIACGSTTNPPARQGEGETQVNQVIHDAQMTHF